MTKHPGRRTDDAVRLAASEGVANALSAFPSQRELFDVTAILPVAEKSRPFTLLRALGLMSGTSMDGIDIAIIVTDGESTVTAGPGRTFPYPPQLREALSALLGMPEKARHEPLTDLEEAVTDAHVDAVKQFLDDEGLTLQSVDLIGFHGQTVLHRPHERFTRQLGLGTRMAEHLGISTVDRFRYADVAAGGEGAPFVPVYHRALASGLAQPLAVLNLGGVGNVTYLDHERMIAFDTGPACAMIDDFMRQRFGKPYDRDGELAASGNVEAALVRAFLDDPYFSRPAPKSLDRNAFHRWAGPVTALDDADAAATLTAFTVEAVVAAMRLMPKQPLRWLVTGGGRQNRFVMNQLAGRLAAPVESVEQVGWNGDLLEAQAFAYLAVRSLRGLPLSYPATTGVEEPMPGGVLHRTFPVGGV